MATLKLQNQNILNVLLLTLMLWLFNPQASLATERVYQFHNAEDIEAILQDALNGDIEPNHTMDNGVTALMVATHRGDVDSVNELLKINVNIDQQKNDGFTSLMLASEQGYTELVNIFLKKGAKINKANRLG